MKKKQQIFIIHFYLVLAQQNNYTTWVINLDTVESSPMPDMYVHSRFQVLIDL